MEAVSPQPGSLARRARAGGAKAGRSRPPARRPIRSSSPGDSHHFMAVEERANAQVGGIDVCTSSGGSRLSSHRDATVRHAAQSALRPELTPPRLAAHSPRTHACCSCGRPRMRSRPCLALWLPARHSSSCVSSVAIGAIREGADRTQRPCLAVCLSERVRAG